MDSVVKNHIETLIFCAPEPISVSEIKNCLDEIFEAKISDEDIIGIITELQEKFLTDEFSFTIENIGGGYQFLTKPAFQASIGIYLKQRSKKRLSTSALETLAIIAYKQPITKGEIEKIRGVNSDYTVQKLLEKELLEIKGKANTVGKPLMYGTSASFMDYFGINSIDDLPVPKDFLVEENTIGEEQDVEVDQ